MSNEIKHEIRTLCYVCGLQYKDFLPWGEDGKTPSHSICSCCGTEWGYGDVLVEAVKKNREKWIQGGAKWFEANAQPVNWLLEEQLNNIPPQYR